jgi:hypothetical protein
VLAQVDLNCLKLLTDATKAFPKLPQVPAACNPDEQSRVFPKDHPFASVDGGYNKTAVADFNGSGW